MKLSYRDRIILIVAAVIVIIAVGIFVFIKPKATEIKDNKATLATVQQEWAKIEAEIAEIPKLQENIQTVHAEAKKTAAYFTEQRTTFELDQFLQEYIDNNELFLEASGLAVTKPSTRSIPFYYYTPDVLTYSLYETADLDGSLKLELEEKMKESTELSKRTAQTVVASSASFSASITKENLVAFLKDIKDLDTSIIVSSVMIDDYTFCPEDSVDLTDLTGKDLEEAEEGIDHAIVNFTVDFYSVQTPTEVDLGE